MTTSSAPAPPVSTDPIIVHTRDITIKVGGGSWQTALTFARVLQYEFEQKAAELERAMTRGILYGIWDAEITSWPN